MARTIRDSKLDSREARGRLKAQAKPHWRTLRPGELHLGYRRRRKDQPGHWVERRYLGKAEDGQSIYKIERLGIADDFQAADGVSTLSFAQAQDLALKVKAEGGGPLTVRGAMANYIKFLRAENRRADDAETMITALVLPELGDREVSHLTTAMLDAWKIRLANSPARMRGGVPREAVTDEQKRARRATVNRVLNTLKAMLNLAVKQKLVPKELAAEWGDVARFRDVEARRPGHLSIEEAMRLVNAADKESGFRDLLRAALTTGMRYQELARLKVRDFAHGKLALHRSKGKVRTRFVTLNPEGAALFEELAAGRPGDAPMLRNHARADRVWRKGDQDRHMRTACDAAAIPRMGVHQTRHSWATLSVQAGMPLQLVAFNLGHVDTRQVERHYGHLTESYVDAEIRRTAPTFGMVERSNVRPLRHGKKLKAT